MKYLNTTFTDEEYGRIQMEMKKTGLLYSQFCKQAILKDCKEWDRAMFLSQGGYSNNINGAIGNLKGSGGSKEDIELLKEFKNIPE